MIYIALNNSPKFGGGVEQVVNNLMAHFSETSKQRIKVICNDPYEKAEFEHQGVTCINLQVPGTSSAVGRLFFLPQLRFSRALARYLADKAQPGDVVNIHGIEYAVFPALDKKRSYQLVITTHGCYFEQYSEYLAKRSPSGFTRLFFRTWRWYVWLVESKALRGADRLIAVSRHAKEFITATYSVTIPYEVIVNGVEAKKIKKRPEKRETKFSFVIVGSKEYLKGLDLALAAVGKLSEELPGTMLTIVGFSELPQEIRERLYVHYVGRISPDEVEQWYDAADIFLMPSRFEVAPLSMLEALQRGLPVVVSPVCHLEELPGGEQLGTIVKEYTPEAWYQAIKAMTDINRYNELVTQVSKFDGSDYEWQSIARQYETVFFSL